MSDHGGIIGHRWADAAFCRTGAGSASARSALVERVRGIVTALAIAETMEGFVREAAPGWRVHRLSGERRREWSVSVSGNWRITFEEWDGTIERLNLEDYH